MIALRIWEVLCRGSTLAFISTTFHHKPVHWIPVSTAKYHKSSLSSSRRNSRILFWHEQDHKWIGEEADEAPHLSRNHEGVSEPPVSVCVSSASPCVIQPLYYQSPKPGALLPPCEYPTCLKPYKPSEASQLFSHSNEPQLREKSRVVQLIQMPAKRQSVHHHWAVCNFTSFPTLWKCPLHLKQKSRLIGDSPACCFWISSLECPPGKNIITVVIRTLSLEMMHHTPFHQTPFLEGRREVWMNSAIYRLTKIAGE